MSSGLVPDIISGPMDHHLRMISRTRDGSHVVRASTLLLVLAVLSSVHTVHTTYTHTDIHYALRASVCYALGDGVLPMRCHQDSGSMTYGSGSIDHDSSHGSWDVLRHAACCTATTLPRHHYPYIAAAYMAMALQHAPLLCTVVYRHPCIHRLTSLWM